ncbi:MAG TPA: aquaporin [Novosphingobium sp.]|nr:aquaporin [Novosphingobium sp.]
MRALAAEAAGSFLLFATVVGSGIMGEQLAEGNLAVALLANAVATGAILYVLITVLGPLSGAHFNPAVSLVMALMRRIEARRALAYAAVQVVGGIAGVWAAHAMFDLPILQLSAHVRTGAGQWLGEAVATAGLILTILGAVRFAPDRVAACVGLYITAGYWFTSSTSFANPAITLARALTDTFAGIAPADVPLFIAAQLAGALAALALGRGLFGIGQP